MRLNPPLSKYHYQAKTFVVEGSYLKSIQNFMGSKFSKVDEIPLKIDGTKAKLTRNTVLDVYHNNELSLKKMPIKSSDNVEYISKIKNKKYTRDSIKFRIAEVIRKRINHNTKNIKEYNKSNNKNNNEIMKASFGTYYQD